MAEKKAATEERTWSETIEVAGNRLVDEVKELVQENAVRRLIIRKPDDDVLIEIPLAAGVAVGGFMTFFTPVLAALGAMAALVAQFRIEIVRAEDEDDEAAPKVDEAEATKETEPA